MNDVLCKLPVPGAVHRVPKPVQPALMSRLLKPFVVFELCLEREVEWSSIARRGTPSQQPRRKTILDLGYFVGAVGIAGQGQTFTPRG